MCEMLNICTCLLSFTSLEMREEFPVKIKMLTKSLKKCESGCHVTKTLWNCEIYGPQNSLCKWKYKLKINCLMCTVTLLNT